MPPNGWEARFADEAAFTLGLEAPQAELLALKLRVLAFEASETATLLGEPAPGPAGG